MTGISDLIAKKEQQARDDERKAIVSILKLAAKNANKDANKNKSLLASAIEGALEAVYEMIERGEHRKGAK